MSKQAQATIIYEMGFENGHSRKEIIEEICEQLCVSSAYASTLYNNARKAINKAQSKNVTKTETVKTSELAGKISTFDRTNLKRVRASIVAKLKEVEAEFGINLTDGNIRFSENSFTMKLEATTGNPADAAKEKWDAYCFRIGMRPEDFGKTFNVRGDEFRIDGYITKGKKYQVSVSKTSNGRGYKMTASMVKGALK